MSSILIAGGDGFIGTNLQKLLQSHDIGFDVVDLKSGTDVCDVGGSKHDIIILLAANLNQDMQMFQDNLRVYKWAARQPAHIIYTSSAAVYGDSTDLHTEDEPTPAPTLYGRSKLLGEQIIRKACSNYTIVRLSNVYGDGDGNGVIDIFKRGGTKIYGTGTNVRDYVSVQVVCRALMTIALDPSKYNHETFNISTQKGMSTKEAFLNYGSGKPEHIPERGFDVEYSVLNNSKASRAGLL